MLPYCLKCKKNTESIDPKLPATSNGKTMILSKCAICGSDLNGEEITGIFYENELQKIDQQEFRIENVIKKKGDKLYVKWKGYDNSFNRWIDKKDLV